MRVDEYHVKLVYYATAPRATAAEITSFVGGDFVTMWAGKLRGKFVKLGEEFKFEKKEDALDLARRYRKSCLEELQAGPKSLTCIER